jgi:hypothetical protein
MVKKTMHELANEFPEKTYKELEKYRDADRQEEARQIFTQQENEELMEEQKGVCITAALKKDRSYPDLTEVLAVENDKLKKEIIQLGKDNRKLSKQIEDGIDRMRKVGLI